MDSNEINVGHNHHENHVDLVLEVPINFQGVPLRHVVIALPQQDLSADGKALVWTTTAFSLSTRILELQALGTTRTLEQSRLLLEYQRWLNMLDPDKNLKKVTAGTIRQLDEEFITHLHAERQQEQKKQADELAARRASKADNN